jgi:DNA-binding transcriptional MerR regulator
MSIGGVLEKLRGDFPEVTISKIRFLEAEGLVEPRRTASGYRKFSPEDVERLAYVLRMQRDHYLPLKVIREHLEAMDRGAPPPALPGAAAGADGAAASGAPVRSALPHQQSGPGAVGAPAADGLSEVLPGGVRLGRAELLAAAEVEGEELAAWESYGLVVAGPDGAFDAEMLQVALLVAKLGRFGLEPRHLRQAKAAAEREVTLVEQVVAPLRRHRNPQTRTRAQHTARELADLSVQLHAALVRAGLRRQLGA